MSSDDTKKAQSNTLCCLHRYDEGPQKRVTPQLGMARQLNRLFSLWALVEAAAPDLQTANLASKENLPREQMKLVGPGMPFLNEDSRQVTYLIPLIWMFHRTGTR